MKTSPRVLIGVFLVSFAGMVYLFYYLLSTNYLNDAPIEYQKFLKSNDQHSIKHFDSRKRDQFLPFSVYVVNDEFGLLIFRKKVTKGIDSLPPIEFTNHCTVDNTTPSIGSIFGQELNYSFTSENAIEQIHICMDVLNHSVIQEMNSTSMYLVFPVEYYYNIRFKQVGPMQVFGKKNTAIKDERNEILIHYEEEYVYFFILKPYASKIQQEVTLKQLINIDF